MQTPRITPDQAKRLGLYLRESKAAIRGSTKEVGDQERVGTRWAAANGCVIPAGRIYIDNDLSASIYATKARKDFERLCRDIESGLLDYVWFWSLSRSARRLDMYVKLRDLCQAKGVNWVVDGRIFDLTDPMDLRSLGMSAVDDEVFSRQLSKNVRRGLAEGAAAGKPHGHTTYGFKRQYNERREYTGQVPDDATRQTSTGHWYSPASVVSDIIGWIAKGTPIAQIKRDLEERAIPTPSGGKEWVRSVIRRITTNKAYIGTRVHVAGRTGPVSEIPNAWPPVDPDEKFPEIFAKAQMVLSSPTRKTTKPGRARHLLSYVARCTCGDVLQAKGGNGRRMYACVRRCSAIPADDLDLFVQAVIDGYLAREDVQAFLVAGQGDDSEAIEARREAATLREELEAWRKLADAGDVTPLDYARFSKALRTRIDAAEARAEEASVSPVIPKAVDWTNLPVARQTVAALADIRLKPIGKGRRHIQVNNRVKWRWLIGPDAS